MRRSLRTLMMALAALGFVSAPSTANAWPWHNKNRTQIDTPVRMIRVIDDGGRVVLIEEADIRVRIKDSSLEERRRRDLASTMVRQGMGDVKYTSPISAPPAPTQAAAPTVVPIGPIVHIKENTAVKLPETAKFEAGKSGAEMTPIAIRYGKRELRTWVNNDDVEAWRTLIERANSVITVGEASTTKNSTDGESVPSQDATGTNEPTSNNSDNQLGKLKKPTDKQATTTMKALPGRFGLKLQVAPSGRLVLKNRTVSTTSSGGRSVGVVTTGTTTTMTSTTTTLTAAVPTTTTMAAAEPTPPNPEPAPTPKTEGEDPPDDDDVGSGWIAIGLGAAFALAFVVFQFKRDGSSPQEGGLGLNGTPPPQPETTLEDAWRWIAEARQGVVGWDETWPENIVRVVENNMKTGTNGSELVVRHDSGELTDREFLLQALEVYEQESCTKTTVSAGDLAEHALRQLDTFIVQQQSIGNQDWLAGLSDDQLKAYAQACCTHLEAAARNTMDKQLARAAKSVLAEQRVGDVRLFVRMAWRLWRNPPQAIPLVWYDPRTWSW